MFCSRVTTNCLLRFTLCFFFYKSMSCPYNCFTSVRSSSHWWGSWHLEFTEGSCHKRSSTCFTSRWYLKPSTSKSWLTFWLFSIWKQFLFLHWKWICHIPVPFWVHLLHTSLGFVVIITNQLVCFTFLLSAQTLCVGLKHVFFVINYWPCHFLWLNR